MILPAAAFTCRYYILKRKKKDIYVVVVDSSYTCAIFINIIYFRLCVTLPVVCLFCFVQHFKFEKKYISLFFCVLLFLNNNILLFLYIFFLDKEKKKMIMKVPDTQFTTNYLVEKKKTRRGRDLFFFLFRGPSFSFFLGE